MGKLQREEGKKERSIKRKKKNKQEEMSKGNGEGREGVEEWNIFYILGL